MSLAYWGIVGGVLAMVMILFACIDVLYSKPKGLSKSPSITADRSVDGVPKHTEGRRQAA